MTPQEAKKLAANLDLYNRLEARCDEIRNTIGLITTDLPDDPNQTGPFTGNTRESRKITRLRIDFSKTLGGSPEVDMTLCDLRISAGEFQKFLLSVLEKDLSACRSQMEKL